MTLQGTLPALDKRSITPHNQLKFCFQLPQSSPYWSPLSGRICGSGAAGGPLTERPGAGKSGRHSSRHLAFIIVILFHFCVAARVQDDVQLVSSCRLHIRGRVHLHAFHLVNADFHFFLITLFKNSVLTLTMILMKTQESNASFTHFTHGGRTQYSEK